MMFGEVELDSLTPQCKGDDCPLGAWLIPICWVVYMMVSNVLIVNVIIAVFNGIYREVDNQAVEVWMFKRFTFVMEFEQKPWLPPPFIIVCHVLGMFHSIFKRCIRCICEEELLQDNLNDDEKPHVITQNDHNLKSFLSPTEQHMVFDFEEENVDLIRHLLSSKDQQGSTSNNEALLAYRTGMVSVASEKSNIQKLKTSLQELYTDMEAQKTKLDKLIEIWEMETDNDDENDPTDDSSREPLAVSSASSVSLYQTGPRYRKSSATTTSARSQRKS